MITAQMLIVKLNTIARQGNETIGPVTIAPVTDKDNNPNFRPVIQKVFEEELKGIGGYVLVLYKGQMFQCERDNVDPTKPYIRHRIRYHPLANKFTSRVA